MDQNINKDTKFCTGSIITKYLVLTAAHCLTKFDKKDSWVHYNTTKFEKKIHAVKIFSFN